jgi:molybdenum-dependent DNA-binding transcriptional regulator ModE
MAEPNNAFHASCVTMSLRGDGSAVVKAWSGNVAKVVLLTWPPTKPRRCAHRKRSNKQKKSCRVMPIRHQDIPPMKARHLRIHAAALHYFDAIRRAGSIRAAARRLNVASSAVNRQILSLEAEIGAQLFDRLPAGLKLTAAGEILAHHVIIVLRDAERTESELDALHGLRAGRAPQTPAPDARRHWPRRWGFPRWRGYRRRC